MSQTASVRPGAPEISRLRLPLHWLGVAPFFIFALLFLILPTIGLIAGAFKNAAGDYTLDNIIALSQPKLAAAYW
ncbi:MAG: acriflavin resistance protein, partial [Mesorhizobium sp.]